MRRKPHCELRLLLHLHTEYRCIEFFDETGGEKLVEYARYLTGFDSVKKMSTDAHALEDACGVATKKSRSV